MEIVHGIPDRRMGVHKAGEGIPGSWRGAGVTMEAGRMKHFVLIMLALLTLMALLTGLVFARLAHPRTDCRSRVMVFKDPREERLECVCAEGTLATCFKPWAVANGS
jgi:Na+/H+-dicarboxylate symporter